MKLVKKKLNSLIPYENNPRKNEAAIPVLVESISQCSYIAPIIVDENMVILAGHTRLAALEHMGYKEANVLIADGLTEDQKKKYRLLDNKVGEKADWDFSKLEEELKGIDWDGFDFDFPEMTLEEMHEEEAEKTQSRVSNILNLGLAEYPGVGKYDIPELLPVKEIPSVTSWIGFNYVLSDKDPEHKGVHFFIDDYQFERLWDNPDAYIEKLKQYAVVATPDFSPYGDMPIATQIWNHYRKHWVGRYLQEHGVTVIPTVRASTDPRSYEWYLDGEPKEGIVIISSMWASKYPAEFMDEYLKMYSQLKPVKVFVYGGAVDGLPGNIENISSFTQSRWVNKSE